MADGILDRLRGYPKCRHPLIKAEWLDVDHITKLFYPYDWKLLKEDRATYRRRKEEAKEMADMIKGDIDIRAIPKEKPKSCGIGHWYDYEAPDGKLKATVSLRWDYVNNSPKTKVFVAGVGYEERHSEPSKLFPSVKYLIHKLDFLTWLKSHGEWPPEKESLIWGWYPELWAPEAKSSAIPRQTDAKQHGLVDALNEAEGGHRQDNDIREKCRRGHEKVYGTKEEKEARQDGYKKTAVTTQPPNFLLA